MLFRSTASGSAFFKSEVSASSFTGSFTGSLTGTATTASFVTTSQTASFVTTAQTASYVKTAQTASFFSGTVTSASYATTASYINTLNQDVILSGSLSLSAGTHVTLAGGAGTKIGTAANQRLAFFYGTPQSQPDNFIGGAVFANGAGLQITDDATFDGYTIAQVVAALRQLGLLA